jgi:hypothetical protein
MFTSRVLSFLTTSTCTLAVSQLLAVDQDSFLIIITIVLAGSAMQILHFGGIAYTIQRRKVVLVLLHNLLRRFKKTSIDIPKRASKVNPACSNKLP